MPRAGSPQHSSDSEDSAPELLTLSSTKKESRSRADAVSAFQAAQKAKRKRENRARDAALQEAKARAREEREHTESHVKRRKGRQQPRREELEARLVVASAEERMERAMREAAGEDRSDSESGSEPEGGDEEEWQGIATSDVDSDGVDDAGLAPSNHLPEHLFSAVAPRPPSFKTTPTASTDKSVKKKRKRSKPKELIVGSRTLRTLPSLQNDTLTGSLTLPPARINRFLKRTLRLKETTRDKKGGEISSTRKKRGALQTWERRPVNIGVLRTTGGPAARFVRGA